MNKYLLKKDENTSGMLSVSQILSYLKCQKAWEYSYIQNMTRRIERPYLTIGKLCHQGMQGAWTAYSNGASVNDSIEYGYKRMNEYYKKYRETVPILEEEVEIFDGIFNDACVIFTNSYKDFEPEKYEVVKIGDVPAIELHFKLPIKGTKGLHGFIDLIVKDKNTNQIWLVDYKFRSTLEDPSSESFNMQNAVYMKASEYLGLQCVGSMTYQYLNQAPSIPKLNKNGTVSRALIKTNWATYASFCASVGQDPNDYAEEMIPKLSSIEWSRPVFEYRSDDMVNNMFDNIITPSIKNITSIKKAYSKGTMKTNIACMYPMNCRLCSFVEVCQGEIRGYDVEYIKEAEFCNKDDVKFDIDE